MEKEDFEIGKEFYTAAGKWRCTDIGTRVVVAIHLNQDDPRNYNGPPYSISENVFDEYDMEGCSLNPADFEDEEEMQHIDSQLFRDIEYAMMFVSSAGYGENSAILDKATGKIYYQSAFGDFEELEGLEENEYDPDIHIEIPHKNDLDLGKELVFKFVERTMPDSYDRVYNIFGKRGAYSRYKDLLDSKGLLQKWYDFEKQKEQVALIQWCQENEINIG